MLVPVISKKKFQGPLGEARFALDSKDKTKAEDEPERGTRQMKGLMGARLGSGQSQGLRATAGNRKCWCICMCVGCELGCMCTDVLYV